MQAHAHKKSQKLFLDRWVYGVGCRVSKVIKVIKVIKDYKVIKVSKVSKVSKDCILSIVRCRV